MNDQALTRSESGEFRLGEVVEASTTLLTAQCYELYTAPPLGSLVRCGTSDGAGHNDDAVYGIVYEVSTNSIDPSRRPIARGRDEDDEDSVYEANPQLSRLLSTEFNALVVGHRRDGTLYRWLAPLPPRIHSFVYDCSDDDLREFSSALDFAPILLSAPIVATDDVLAAFLKRASAVHLDPSGFLVRAGRQLTPLLGGEVQRLNGILRRIAPSQAGFTA